MITKRIFLIFPPGCGGNHLANMISLDDDVEDRIADIEKMKEYYSLSPNNVHPKLPDLFLGYQNLKVDVDKVNQATKTFIICSHAFEFASSLRSKTIPIDWIKDSVFILFTYPTEKTLGHNRMINHPAYKGEHPDTHKITIDNFLCEIETAYYPENFVRAWDNPAKPELETTNVFSFDTDRYLSETGFAYVTRFFNHLFDMSFKPDAKELHEIVYKNWANENYFTN